MISRILGLLFLGTILITFVFWKKIYYDFLMPVYVSGKMGEPLVLPWDIERSFIDISLDGTEAYWYLSRQTQESIKCLENTNLPTHESLSNSRSVPACLAKKIYLSKGQHSSKVGIKYTINDTGEEVLFYGIEEDGL